MAAPSADAEVTRVVFDSGPKRIVLMAYELFARTDNDFGSAVYKQTAAFPMKVTVEEWTLAAPLRGYAYFPVSPTRDQEANLVMGLYVVQQDSTVQHLVFFANPPAASNSAEVRDLARSIAGTVIPGKRMLNDAPGDRMLYASNKTAVFVTVPSGYVMTEQPGPDFFVYHIRRLTTFGEPGASIGVYLGDHPSTDREGLNKRDATTLFGKQAQWYEKESKEGQMGVFTNALVPLGPSLLGHAISWSGDLPSYADVFLQAKDAAGIEELKKVAATLRIGKSK